jgi:hypothetical protein
MGMGEDEVMTYRLGGGPLWYSCWTLLDDREKVDARATMTQACPKSRDLGVTEMMKRVAKMVLGPNGLHLYKFGHGSMYYDIWDILTDVEQVEARLQMKAIAFTTNAAGSLSKAENASLAAQYICAENMNADHELFIHPAFYSHRLHHAVSVWCTGRYIEKTRAGWMEARMQVRATKSIRGERQRKASGCTEAMQVLLQSVCAVSGNQTCRGHLWRL